MYLVRNVFSHKNVFPFIFIILNLAIIPEGSLLRIRQNSKGLYIHFPEGHTLKFTLSLQH